MTVRYLVQKKKNMPYMYVFIKRHDNLVIVKDDNGNRKEYPNMGIKNAIDQFRRDTDTRWTRYTIITANGY